MAALAPRTTYLNTAEGVLVPHLPPKDYHINTPAEEYDLNYVFPAQVLESNGVRLEPFIPSLHAREAHELLLRSDPTLSVFRWMPYQAPATLTDFLTWIESGIRSQRGACLYLITDVSGPAGAPGREGVERRSGWIAVINASLENLCGEIAHVTVLPHAQRTHVQTHASCLLMRHMLSPRPSGLALRRCQWANHSANDPSSRAAERLGFTLDGLLRCARVQGHKDGEAVEDERGLGRPEVGNNRDTKLWSVTWKDWRDGMEAKVKAMLEREIVVKQP